MTVHVDAASNADLMARDSRHLIHSLHTSRGNMAGNSWVRGEGSYLIDGDGKRYLDAMSGLWNVTLGHGRRELIEASHRQMSELAYCSGYSGNSNLPATMLAEKLAALAYPSINRFFLTSGGGESTDTTIKFARAYWKAKGRPDKIKVISFMGGYHGTTLAAMCATGMPAYWPPFEPRMPGFVHIPLHHSHRAKGRPEEEAARMAAEDLEQAIIEQGADSVALFIAEPVLGGGAYVAPDGYFQRVREICDRHDVLFAADEVITGFGRTGEMFALRRWGVEPDIVQFAKGITSGYFPLGGVGVSDAIADALVDFEDKPFMHCYTYSGHPVGCAIALATIDVLEREKLPERTGRLGSRLKSRLEADLGQNPHVAEIRGLGLILAIDLVAEGGEGRSPASSGMAGAKALQACRERGLITRGRGDTIYLGPPFTIEEDELDRLADIVSGAVKTL